ncbi:hypothetical protein NDU88_006286 [Pleurodeles waltl]|uniref:Uncharacterized protein n=1 Tax=Pleurodeles waltl TaxID=8319 RepID=A0AAV7TDZ4_PLEWA|nr:hypothetical protein NDU88_006286 [Pleurodeles waltl]
MSLQSPMAEGQGAEAPSVSSQGPAGFGDPRPGSALLIPAAGSTQPRSRLQAARCTRAHHRSAQGPTAPKQLHGYSGCTLNTAAGGRKNVCADLMVDLKAENGALLNGGHLGWSPATPPVQHFCSRWVKLIRLLGHAGAAPVRRNQDDKQKKTSLQMQIS